MINSNGTNCIHAEKKSNKNLGCQNYLHKLTKLNWMPGIKLKFGIHIYSTSFVLKRKGAR